MRYQITTERTNLFDVNAVMGMNIVIRGNISKEIIVAAFHRAVLSHEILNTKVVMDEEGNAYYVENDEHHNSVFFTDESLRTIMVQQERIRFRVENGEYLKLFVRQEEKESYMTFLMHRLAGDAKSLAYFIETFMRLLNGEKVKYWSMRRLSVLDLPADSKLPIKTRLLLRHYNRLWRKEKETFSLADLDKEYQQFWKNRETTFTLTTYDSQKLEKVKKEAKAIGCHLTAYMLTLYLQSRQEKDDIGLVMNARSNDNRAMGNQSTEISIKVQYNSKWSFEKNVLYVQKKFDRCAKKNRNRYWKLRFMAGLDPSLVDAVNMQSSHCFDSITSQRLAEWMGYEANKKELHLTNMKVLDIPDQYGELRIEKVTLIPPVVAYGKNVVGVVTFRDEIHVCVHHYRENRKKG